MMSGKVLKIFFSLIIALSAMRISAQSIAPVDLQCAMVLPNGDINLSFTPVANPCGPFEYYVVYLSVNVNGPYTAYDTIYTESTSTYLHPGANGTITTWYYYIVSFYNCPGFTEGYSDTISNSPITSPVIDYVTVTSSGIEFYWFPTSSPTCYAYVIYYDQGGGFAVAIDTVIGCANNMYLDIIADPNTSVYDYTIAAMDSCGNVYLFNSQPQHNILLTASEDYCAKEITLNWNIYTGWNGGVQGYELWVSVNGAASSLSQSFSNVTSSYVYSGYSTGDILCFTIHAIKNGGSPVSVSNEVCITTSAVQVSSFNYITNVTVSAPNEITVYFLNADTNSLEFIRMQRAAPDSASATFASQNNIPNSGSLPASDTYVDVDVNTENQSYWYRILSIDDCNTEFLSGKGRSIQLTGIINGDLESEIEWNSFYLEHSTVQNYIVHRITDIGSTVAATLPPTQTSFQDDLNPLLSESSSFCYMIEAVHDVSLPNGFTSTESSFSNEICMLLPARAYVPNAFVPDGLNNILKPYIAFSGAGNYTFQVYNRWGKIVFETHDPDAGWDGSYNGKEQPSGGYAYYLEFTADDGKKVVRKGTVVLVR